jgi:hypothetical protein
MSYEHDKLNAVADKSQVIGEFLDWLSWEKGITLATQHKHDEHCTCSDEWHGYRDSRPLATTGCPACGGSPWHPGKLCGYTDGQLQPAYRFSIEDWLAEFFEIDLEKIEQEKRAMIEALRTASEQRPRAETHPSMAEESSPGG